MKRFFLFALSIAFSSALLAADQIAQRVVRTKIAGVDVIAYPTGVKDVVTIHGSLPAGDAFAGDGNVAVPTLVGMLLDKGTKTEDQFAITEKLERVGATISFEVGTQMTTITAKCLKKDAPLVIGLIAEQLRTPALSAEELEKAKKQFAGELQRNLESTDYQAADAFTRAVYPTGHPNRQPAPKEMLAAIESVKIDEVRAFHAKYYGPAHLTFAVVGDLDIPQIQSEVGKAFAGWSGGADVIHPPKASLTDAARDQVVFMPDKPSVSVVMGQTSGLQYRDPDYQALRVGTSIFGGGFAARLMSTVRNEEGLTYGIYSSLDHDTFTDGDWSIEATFAPQNLEQGLASTKRQLAKWVEQGVTDQELADKKGDIVGTFKVALATTDGMATALLNAVHRGYEVTWLDEYPKRIQALTKDDVNRAIKKYVKPGSLYLIKAGTVPGASQK
jgi:zinc protease